MIVFFISLQVSAEAKDNAVGWQGKEDNAVGKEEGQEGEELDERSLKVGLCPTSHMYVFVNTFNLKEMFSIEFLYYFTVVLLCLGFYCV